MKARKVMRIGVQNYLHLRKNERSQSWSVLYTLVLAGNRLHCLRVKDIEYRI